MAMYVVGMAMYVVGMAMYVVGMAMYVALPVLPNELISVFQMILVYIRIRKVYFCSLWYRRAQIPH